MKLFKQCIAALLLATSASSMAKISLEADELKPQLTETEKKSENNNRSATSSPAIEATDSDSKVSLLQLSLFPNLQLFDDDYDIYGLRLGLMAKNKNVGIVDASLLMCESTKGQYGLQVAGLMAKTEGELGGIQAALLGSTSKKDSWGIQTAGLLAQSDGKFKGAQLSLFGVATNGDSAGIQIGGFGSVARKSYDGVQLGLFGAMSNGDSTGCQLAGIVAGSDKSYTGIQTGLFGTICVEDCQGIQIGGIMSAVGGNHFDKSPTTLNHYASMEGIQLSAFMAATEGSFTGIQIAPLASVNGQRIVRTSICEQKSTDTTFKGCQIGCFAISGGKVSGLQTSLLCSMSNKTNGIQMGLINTTKSLTGLQVGLVNWADELKGIQIGLINFDGPKSDLGFPLVNAQF